MSAITHSVTSYYTENNIRYIFIDGFACKKIDHCFDLLQVQLSIPAYFGKNLDALEEVINDLEWITEDKIKIIISNREALLKHDLSKKEALLDILQAATGKLEIVYLSNKEV